LGCLAARPPAQAADFYEHLGEGKDTGVDDILIAYASKPGSTGDAAQAIGEELTARGCVVDVKRIGEVKDVSPYQFILLGSAVRRGRWLPEALGFPEQQTNLLASKSVAYFTVCMTMHQDTPENRARKK
jgi:menaquinone-dependent protoporphyrinogen oxidase